MDHPHANQPVLTAGVPLAEARAVAIMVHGRNAGPANILDLVPRLDRRDVAYLAPAAANGTWYPHSFMAPIETNEPALSSALRALGELVGRVVDAGVPRSRVVFVGFSQGACLAAEFVVRHPSRYGGGIVMSGGLIGPPGTTWPTGSSFEGTPIFLGCSDVDRHVPRSRVDESAATFERLGAVVTERIYPGMGHTVIDDEIDYARRVLDGI